MDSSINKISTKKMLKIIGERLRADAELEKMAEEPLSVLYYMVSSWHLFFANENKGISIKKIYVSNGKVIREEPSYFFTFTRSYYDEVKKRIPKINPDIVREDEKWMEDLFIVEDYEENKSLITECCLNLNWVAEHLAIGDYDSFFNRKKYERIMNQAEDWANSESEG